jgi:hypothetical protein
MYTTAEQSAATSAPMRTPATAWGYDVRVVERDYAIGRTVYRLSENRT